MTLTSNPLQNLGKISKKGEQCVDQLVEVCLRDGKNALLLIHIEVQAGTIGPELPWRVLRYAIRLLEKHPDHTHFSCVILLDRNKGSDTLTYTAPTKGSSLTFSFPVINLGSWTNRQDDLLHEGEQQGASAIVQRQLQRKFGTLSPHVEQRLKQATPAQLETWSLNVLDADNLDDIFTD